MKPLVSILIPCFNAARLVAQAIESALAQTGPAIEVIVVDDGSTDGSLDVIRQFDGQICWETGPNRGANAARNRLLDLCNGEWVQYLDADDYLLPGKVARQFEFAVEHSDCDVIVSPTISEEMENGKASLVRHQLLELHDPWVLLAHWELPQTGGPLWKKAALKRVKGWQVEQPCCQEHELYFRLLAAGCRFERCDCCLTVYRVWNHGVRISNRLRDEVYRQRLLILDRIEGHLKANDELTAARHDAINDTRHATARMLWQRDRRWAREVARSLRASDPNYYPRHQPASPPHYSLVYRALGFTAAQILASCRRALPLTAHHGSARKGV
jgi:glycosyltransferase involved in cell wall biosynthesis